jgi:hypothetical protein
LIKKIHPCGDYKKDSYEPGSTSNGLYTSVDVEKLWQINVLLKPFGIPRSFVLCVMLCKSLLVLFLLVIMLSVLLRFTTSDYPFWYLQTFLILYEKVDDTKGVISSRNAKKDGQYFQLYRNQL